MFVCYDCLHSWEVPHGIGRPAKCGEEIELFKIDGGEHAATDLCMRFIGRIPIDAVIVESGDRGIPFVLAVGATSGGTR